MKYRVNGEPNLIRDSRSKAILFTNDEQTKEYLRKKQQIESQKTEINTLKQEIAELKTLVLQLIERQENR